jgi:hypothetical protein
MSQLTSEEREKCMKYYSARDVFVNSVVNSIEHNSVATLEYLMSSSLFSVLSEDEKQSLAFQATYLSLDKNPTNDILKYLVFDYRIKEEMSINLIIDEVHPIVKDMFDTRRLNDELVSELDKNLDKSIRKLKI